MTRIFLFILIVLPVACSFDQEASRAVSEILLTQTDSIPRPINTEGKTVETRFPVPEGFIRLSADSNSFATYLRQLPLLPDSAPVFLFDGRLKNRQDVHCAVLDIDVGRRDLQQCADAVMRLRAEYLFGQKRYADIHFNFTNGFRADYARWQRGERIRVDGNRVFWVAGSSGGGSYADFRKYLTMVFSYAGTASLERELRAVKLTALRPGDVWIKGGHPGHAVLVLDVAEDPQTGERRFLLAQSYMPAQQIHVLRNPENASPWYSVLQIMDGLETPEWYFEKEQLRRFSDR